MAISDNLHRIQDRILSALARSGRTANSVTLVAVTKTVGIREVQELYRLGITNFGESRVQAVEPKKGVLDSGVTWHMIGNIQRRKCKDVVRLFDCVDAVDRIELAEELGLRAGDRPSPLPVLIEVNVSGEESKHGFAVEVLPQALEQMRAIAALQVEGLMTMAPFFDNAEQARPIFAELRTLADRFGLKRVSMGMSNDFEVAIEEGSTEVRIGSALLE
ncbi:MAG: YggS family pyridoxal phosphate-dependent enzyme [Candidatus Hydrogenedentes bacterium]|nr:YggS family pyridoxal phosphate-dependent enzyme [Candidatus Hydrogenedentota bacterium]